MRLPLAITLITLLLNCGVDAYIAQALRRLRARAAFRTLHLWSAAALTLTLVALACLPKREGSQAELSAIMWALFSYFSIYIPKLLFVICDSAGRLAGRLLHRRARGFTIAGCALAATAFATLWWGATINRFNIDVRRVTVDVADLPDAFDGFTIAQISDLHVGTFGSDTAFVSKLVDRVNRLKADLIVFTGDIVNRQTSELPPFTAPLSRLSAPHGVYSILGNHDYGDYYNWPSPAAKEQNMAELRKLQHDMGWRLLDNETATLHLQGDSIALIGVQNIGDPPFPVYGSLAQAYPTLNDSVTKILLTHNPAHWCDSIADSPHTNVALTLSGHTHAMQIELFGLSPAAFRYRTWGGLYNDSRGQRLYVNIGAGEVAIPARIGATPEITLITLRAK